MTINDLSWLVTFLSILGAVYNAKGKIIGFYIWLVANAGWVAYDIYIGAYSQSALFVVYFFISVWGILEWRRHNVGGTK